MVNVRKRGKGYQYYFEISRSVHEALRQRIMVNYTFNGIDYEEVKNYIIDRCAIAEISNSI